MLQSTRHLLCVIAHTLEVWVGVEFVPTFSVRVAPLRYLGNIGADWCVGVALESLGEADLIRRMNDVMYNSL
jgi:hypothetical protein